MKHALFISLITSILPLLCGALHGQEYFADFDSGLPTEFSGGGLIENVQGYDQLGFENNFLRNDDFPASIATLTLTQLPDHHSIHVGFLLAIIDSWDGVGSSAGPDSFNIVIDGKTVFSEVFENSTSGAQIYNPPKGVVLARREQLGFNPGNLNHLDSAYDFGQEPQLRNIRHTADSLTIEWSAGGSLWQGGLDESWAIDNLAISLITFVLGDVNCDGEINLLDVAPFVELLSSGGFSEKADINHDGTVNLLDVQPFVNLLSGG